MRRLCTLACLTLVWLLASPTAAFAHCHGSITYGPGGGVGDCGKAALWGTLCTAAAFAGAVAVSALLAALNFFREPVFRTFPKGQIPDDPAERYRTVGQHRLDRHFPRHRRSNYYRDQVALEYWYKGRELIDAAEKTAKIAKGLAGSPLTGTAGLPSWAGPAAEWGARAAHLSWPALRVGWRWANDVAIRIGVRGGWL